VLATPGAVDEEFVREHTHGYEEFAAAAAEAGIVDGAVPGAELLPVAVARAAELASLRGPVLAANKSRRYADVVEALHRPESLHMQRES
ncbi:hypothetical protein, partial [Streptomyces sp. NPDC096068]|uniref:hypothetical protein n=1 Tax=Streptomyces sp. NPDC096068 TaxID=3155424 RepID=UPI00331811BD